MPKASVGWDVFVAHAHEDKNAIARPLALALRRRGLKVWYDEFSLRVGDSLRKSIDTGLSSSRFGVVILSPHFFAKRWPETELNALVVRQEVAGSKVVLPVWHEVSHEDVLACSPILADRIALPTTLGLPTLVDRILDEVHVVPLHVDLQVVLPTGIPRLDQALRGGLPRRSSIVLQGPKGIGKTTLGLQIQLAALDRGEPSLFISYREPPHDIVAAMIRLGAPLADYVEGGIFRIFDNFSAVNGLTEDEILDPIPVSLRRVVVRVVDPTDREAYYRQQTELMTSMGLGGINVIDSVNERHRLMSEEEDIVGAATKYFQRFRTKLARLGGQTAIHIASSGSGDQAFTRLLGDFEDGVLEMRYVDSNGERNRQIRVSSLRGTRHDERWLEFIIGPNGVEVF